MCAEETGGKYEIITGDLVQYLTGERKFVHQ